MAINYDCFMELAKASMGNTGEQWTRNAVSRAYYCMYHSVLRVVDGKVPSHDKDGNKLPGGSHERFFNYLCDGDAAAEHKLDPAILKRLGLKLKTGHFHRVTADYKLNKQVHKLTAQQLINEAEEIDRLVSDLKKT